MSQYAGIPCERLVQIATGAAPTRSTPAHFVLSPRTSRGMATSGLAMTLLVLRQCQVRFQVLVLLTVALVVLSPSVGFAAPTAPGFTVAIYRAIPVLGAWAALQAFDGAAYGDQLTLPDISGGMALYFAISHAAAGNVILAIAEMD